MNDQLIAAIQATIDLVTSYKAEHDANIVAADAGVLTAQQSIVDTQAKLVSDKAALDALAAAATATANVQIGAYQATSAAEAAQDARDQTVIDQLTAMLATLQG